MNIKSPKSHVVMEHIATLIAQAEPGSSIPTERELASQFGTSRTTVRQALASLAADGQVTRTWGSGTVVATPNRVYVHQLTSYSEDLRAQGHSPASQIVDVSQVKPDRHVAAALGVAPEEKIYRVERVRLIDDEPLALEVAHLNGTLPRLRQELERHNSLYAALREVYAISFARAEDVVECAPASPREAALLDVEPGAPMLAIHRTGYNADDTPIEYTRSVFRGDRFRFVANSSF